MHRVMQLVDCIAPGLRTNELFEMMTWLSAAPCVHLSTGYVLALLHTSSL